jgi:hypothetical protein
MDSLGPLPLPVTAKEGGTGSYICLPTQSTG